MSEVKPLVSVCIPSYNRAKKLERAVRVLLECSYKNIEIVISDNASSDETQKMCNSMAASDCRIKYFRHAVNQGPTKNFDFAKKMASGEFFLWHGDDDYIDADYIEKCVNDLVKNPSLVLVSGLSAYYRDSGEFVNNGNIIQLNSSVAMLRVLRYLWYVRDNSVFCGVYRRAQVEGISMPNCLAGDWAWMSCVLLKGRAKVISSVNVHREFEDSTSSSFSSIVSVIGAPQWHARFPWLAISINVTCNFAFCLSKGLAGPLILRRLSCALVFFVLIAKGGLMLARSFASKIPFARVLYRMFRSEN